MKNVYKIDADIKGSKRITAPFITQNDAVSFVVSVFDGGKEVDLSEVTEFTLASTRLDKTTVVVEGVQTGVNTVTFDIGTEETKYTGVVKAVVQLYGEDGRISTVSFAYSVSADPTGDGFIPSERELTLIEVVLNDGPLAIADARKAAGEARAAAVSVEEAASYAREQGDYVAGKKPLIDEAIGLAGQILDESFDSGALNTNIESKLNDLETQYAPKLSSVESQLADKANKDDVRLKSVKNELEDMSPTVLAAIVGGEGTSFNLLSIPQDFSTTPEKTTFVKRGKNKFDGIYTSDLRLGGGISDGNFRVVSTAGAKSVFFKGEKLKTYTISRSADSDYWGVGTFRNIPKAGEFPIRALKENGVPWASLTVTLQGEEEYIMISISSTGVIPKMFQIEEGTQATDYAKPNKVVVPLEEGSLPFNVLNLDGVNIPPEMTSFASKGKNLFDGNFNTGIRLGGAFPNLSVAADQTAKTVVFKGEKLKAYTLSRSTENDRFGVATFSRYPAVGVAPIRSLSDNTAQPWSEKTITLQGDEEYIMAFVSTTKEPAWFQVEEGSKATSYSPVGAVRILLEDNNKDIGSASLPKINIIKTGNVLKIYIPSETNPDRFLCFTYERVTNATINTDSWLQTNSGIYNKVNGLYNLEFMISTGGDQEGVLRIRGEGDFVGGGVHGHEQVQILDMLIDGKEVNMNSDFNRECSFVKIVQSSTVYRHATSTKAFQKYKASTWGLDTYTVESKWIAQVETDIEVSKTGIFSVLKVNNGKNVLKWGRNNSNFEKTDVSIDFKTKKLMTEKRSDTTLQELWSQDENFYVGLECEYDRSKYTGAHYIEDFGNRAKIYYDLGSFVMQPGEYVKYKNVFNFVF